MKYYIKSCILTLDELKDLCDEWKKILGLQNWDIIILLCNYEELDQIKGSCSWQIKNRHAVIRILDPKFYISEYYPFDMEQVLVHELLHCFWGILDDHKVDSIDDDIHEQNIDLLSIALVGLKREKYKEE